MTALARALAEPRWQRAGIVIVLGGAYLATLLPGLGAGGDVAKFQFVGRHLGTPHETGYPTYLVLNHLFTRFLPVGTLAWRANLLSALFSIGAALAFFEAARGLRVSGPTALAATLVAGLSPTLWSQSVIAEVYSLHALFVMGVIGLFLHWHRTRRRAFLWAGCAVYALSFGNHLSTLTLLPGLLFLVLATERRVFLDPRTLLAVGLFALLGAAQYLYLWWRTHSPSTPYLEMAVDDWSRALYYLRGGQFRSLIFAFTPLEFATERLPRFAALWLRESLFLAPLAVYGALRLEGRVAAFLALLFAGNAFYALNYAIVDFYLYLIPSWLVGTLGLAVALDRLLAPRLSPGAQRAVLAALVLAVAVNGLAGVRREVHEHPHTETAARMRPLLEAAGRDALLLSPGYHETEFLLYYLIGEGWGAERNLHLVHHFSPRAVHDYLTRDRPMWLHEERRSVPPGLALYSASESQARALRKAGLETRPAPGGLYRVLPPP